jgi:hypothetical protein
MLRRPPRPWAEQRSQEFHAYFHRFMVRRDNAGTAIALHDLKHQL